MRRWSFWKEVRYDKAQGGTGRGLAVVVWSMLWSSPAEMEDHTSDTDFDGHCSAENRGKFHPYATARTFILYMIVRPGPTYVKYN